MENTLKNDDRVVVNRAAVSWAHFLGQEYVPERGQIIVFMNENEKDFKENGREQAIDPTPAVEAAQESSAAPTEVPAEAKTGDVGATQESPEAPAETPAEATEANKGEAPAEATDASKGETPAEATDASKGETPAEATDANKGEAPAEATASPAEAGKKGKKKKPKNLGSQKKTT